MDFEIIEEDNFDKARKEIRKNKGKKIIFSSNNDENSRKIAEKENISILLIKQKNRKDFSKQRNSGFNQVMAKIAKKSGISIGILLDEIIESKSKEESEIIARIKQNIKLCNKNKIKMKFITLKEKNKRNIRDLQSLGLVLGMPTWMIKDL